MTLITRQEKGSRLTIQEMDNNLQTLKDLTTQEGDEIFVPEFKQNYGINQISGVNTHQMQTDGKVCMFGNFTSYGLNDFGSGSVNRITRLTNSGLIDWEYNKNTGSGFNNHVWDSAIQNDQKTIMVGDFTTFNGVVVNRIVRLNTDGSLDESFLSGTGTNTGGRIKYDKWNNKIYISGQIIYNGTTIKRLARLNIDGTIDETFNVLDGLTGSPHILPMPNGKLFIWSGALITYGENSYNNTLMLNSDGSVYEDFQSVVVTMISDGVGGSYTAPKLFSDGKIILFGEIQAPTSGLVILNPDGSVFQDFQTGTGFEGPPPFRVAYGGSPVFAGSRYVCDVVEDNGKIIVTGTPWIYNGVAYPKMIRLNYNGTIDETFNVGNGAIDGSQIFVTKTENYYLLVGHFIAFNNRLMRTITKLKIQE
jgi:uncharacterized delta-60 repeat protein